jgi:hypothetical protein
MRRRRQLPPYDLSLLSRDIAMLLGLERPPQPTGRYRFAVVVRGSRGVEVIGHEPVPAAPDARRTVETELLDDAFDRRLAVATPPEDDDAYVLATAWLSFEWEQTSSGRRFVERVVVEANDPDVADEFEAEVVRRPNRPARLGPWRQRSDGDAKLFVSEREPRRRLSG